MIGQTISHYKILEKLGEGGMGVVYKAEDLNLDRQVALKFLPEHVSAESDARKRFILEAKSASSLDHPNICTIHEIGETAKGGTFIVMPCYEGQTLAERVAQGPMDIVETLDIACQVASGLARAHDKGIVHRDIKPGNILMTEDGQIKIVDFGLAKLSGRTKITRTGTTMGTASYMSPEQAVGDEVGPASDVFSFGVVLYELLVGRPPFEGEHEAAILYQLVHEDAPSVSTYRGDVPASLAAVVERALSKDVEQRYRDASDLGEALETVAEELGVGTPTRRRRFIRRRGGPGLGRRAVVGLWVAAVALAAITVMVTRQLSLTPTSAHALAVVDFRDLATPEDRTVSAGMTGLIHVGLVENSPVRVISPEYLYDLRRRLFDADSGPIEDTQALEVARQSGATVLLTGQMGSLGGTSYVTWRLVDIATGKSLGARRVQGKNQVLLADEIIAGVLPLLAEESGTEPTGTPPSVSTLTTSSQDAYKHYVAGTLALEEARTEDAFAAFEAAVGLDSTFALAFFGMSRSRDLDLEREAARTWAQLAWKQRTGLGVKDRMRLEAWRERIADRDVDAMDTYKEMLTRWPDDRNVLIDLSDILFWNWYFDQCAAVAAQALTLYQDDSYLANTYGTTLAFTGRPNEAVAIARTFVGHNPDNPNAWDDLGLGFLALGLPDSAEAAFRHALELEPDFFGSHKGIGYCHYTRGDLEGAIATFEAILTSGNLVAADSIEIFADVSFWPGLALCHLEAGRPDKALAVYDTAWRNTSVPDNARELESRIQLLLRMGRPREALERARELWDDADSNSARLSAKRYLARSLVALDSLPAARVAAGELGELEKTSGRQEPFQLLRVTADIALAEGNGQGALEALQNMAAHGVPLGGLKDLERRESEARALQLTGRSKDAIAVLNDLLDIYGGHALARYELGKLYQEMGRVDDARKETAAFLNAWSRAESGLPVVEDARARLQALDSGR